MNNLRTFSIITDIGNTELHDFEASNWREARVTFIGSAFEHQVNLSKEFKPGTVVNSKMDAHHKHEISFTTKCGEVERWKLREKNGGVRGWVCNLIASMPNA